MSNSSQSAKQLMSGLLERDPSKRLGCGENGAEGDSEFQESEAEGGFDGGYDQGTSGGDADDSVFDEEDDDSENCRKKQEHDFQEPKKHLN